MAKSIIKIYEDKDHKDKKIIRFDEDGSELHKETEESLKDLLEGTLDLVNGTFIEVKGIDGVVTSKMMNIKVDIYKENYLESISESNEIIKSILDDSCILAKGIDRDVYDTCYGTGLAYCSGYTSR